MTPYTAQTLITRSFYLSQIVGRGLQTVSGEQINDGLYLLNALLEFKSSELQLIPYFTEYFFNTVQGTEMYFIPSLVYTDTMTFNIGPVRYPLIDMSRKEYFNGPRVDNIQSLPYGFRVERVLNGSNVYLYFPPADVYQMRIWGKFSLSDVTLNQDLSLTYDGYYIEYLRYALAEYICSEYGNTFPDQSQKKYEEIRKKLMNPSPPDLTIQKRSYFSGPGVFDWQTINLYKGFLPF